MSGSSKPGPDVSDLLRRQIDELDLFATIARNGLGWGQAALVYEEVVTRMSKYRGRSYTEEELEHGRTRAATVQAFADEQESKGFPYLYNLLAIRIWTILENLVDESAARRVRDPKIMMTLKGLEGLSVPLLQFLSAGEDARTEFIVDTIKQATKSRLKIGVGRFESLLEAVGLGGEVPDSIKRTILELSEIRNVLVHRDGVCDRRIVERCPWLTLNAGQQVAVSEEQFRLFRLLPGWYICEMHRRAGDVAADLVDLLNEAVQKLEEAFKKNAPDRTSRG